MTGLPMRSAGLSRLVLLGMALACTVMTVPRTAAGQARAAAFAHADFAAILARHAGPAGVDYARLKADRAPLDAYVARLADVTAAEFDAWSRDERVAYLINAYNAFVLLGVIDNYPIRRSLRPSALVRPANSIWQISGFFDSIRRRAAGRDLTLDDIEHVWLRATLREPRVHFALVCAARSCPPLRREAYRADRLDAQLDEQARLFLNDASANRFEPRTRVVRLSSIFNWFGEDFEDFAPPSGFAGSTAERGVLSFATRFLPAETARWLEAGGYRIDYLSYDWALNDAR